MSNPQTFRALHVRTEAQLADDKRHAKLLEANGVKFQCSTGIHGYITRGYGDLDEYGFWQYPLEDGEYVGT